MQTKTSLYRNMFFIVFMILLVGCASVTNADMLAGSETCNAPCWMDIQPGLTKTDDAIEILKEHENKGEGDLAVLDSGIVRWQSADDYNLYIYETSNGIVSKMELDVRPRSIHLEEVIALFGAPLNLDIGKVRDGFFWITIFYPEKGLAFVVGGNKFDVTQKNIGFVIQPDMTVAKCVFFQPTDISSMVHLLYGANAVPEALSDIQDWIGYGVYHE